ncbi:putative metalloprotease with PDZ domain [Gramella sp. Hel_I_59]|uniref:M61 family metallopeptidase n=1 Tax=Gramella sp. Hel_I_59 TaxID=1249978 RepID=UPI00114F5CBC|nr:PDZ domain-containing protein [Gramella sp. Hel_I_59]TQI72182.1 putative metalloprotease with PDZ domain [Gramella sp. Hel_I_59]
MRSLLLLLLLTSMAATSQVNTYKISFSNAVHHEAKIEVTFPKIKSQELTVRMSRTSPGRYALHEFAKNVYGFKAFNSEGKELEITREDPYSWTVKNTDGTISIEYILYANRGDGTYSQVDASHAHLNIPATFMYSEELKDRDIELQIDLQDQPDWKIATQLEKINEKTFKAPDLYYFMDSPIEISDHQIRSFEHDGQKIEFVLHHQGTEAELDQYFEQIKAIVEQEAAVFGELPDYDYGRYTFLACYMPNASGDGMEHRNSTILTKTDALADGGMKGNIGTAAHEFFHGWNVERIRPADLEPFSFSEVNMSRNLWFAEGFTSYYTGLILHRAGITSEKEYIEGLSGTFNYVWNSPATRYFNPMEMSMQAPFVDAAKSVDPVNRENTFISYYSYGSILGLALDLSLREEGLNLDDFMKMMWHKYGKNEVAYDTEDIENTLTAYAGKEFSDNFFAKHIRSAEKPDYRKLFDHVGVSITQDSKNNHFGASFRETENGLQISRNTVIGSPAYEACLNEGDLITSANGTPVNTSKEMEEVIAGTAEGEKISLEYQRFGETKTTSIELSADPDYKITLSENASKEQLKNRKKWLESK